MQSFDIDRLVPRHVIQFEAHLPSPPADELRKMYGFTNLIRLNNNENPLGPPPAAAAVINSFPASRAARYPNGDGNPLRNVLAQYLGLTPGQLLLGNGANEVISFVIKTFCEQGDNIVTADRTFAVYEWIARFSGIEARLAPLRDFAFDEDELLALVDRRTKLIFLCNPNNPTGTWWNRQRLIRFMERLGPDHIVAIDEAYNEFISNPEYPNGISLLQQFPNLVVLRTFSKMYGLAGLRIGYLAGSERLVELTKKSCIVYSVNGLAQEAALAATGDMDFIMRTRKMVRDGLDILEVFCKEKKLTYLPSETNFMMIKLPFSDTLAYRLLMQLGIMVRTMTPYRFPNWIRVTISTQEEMRLFCEGLSRIIHSRSDQSPVARAYGIVH